MILEHRDYYVKNLAEAVVMPAALAALTRLAQSPYRIVIATNQALVGRGIIPLADVESINQWMINEIRQAGGRIDAAYICPHHPEAQCVCRKPKPGMLLTAASEHHLDLPRSFMIGDAITDLLAGHAAGARSLLVRTGRGAAQAELLARHGLGHVPIYDDLTEAVQAILDNTLPK